MQQWMYLRGAEKVGPVSSQQLAQLAARGEISAATKVSPSDAERWIPAASVKGLAFPAARPASGPAAPPPLSPQPAANGSSRIGWGVGLLVAGGVVALGGVAAVFWMLRGPAAAEAPTLPAATRPISSKSDAKVDGGIAREVSTVAARSAAGDGTPTPSALRPGDLRGRTPQVPSELALASSNPATSKSAATASGDQAATQSVPAPAEMPVELTALGPAFTVSGQPNPGVFVSPDRQHVAVVAPEGVRQQVLLDGEPGPSYRRIVEVRTRIEGRGEVASPLVMFSPDSQRCAYVAEKSPGEFVVVVDGSEGPSFQHVQELLFSPDSKRFGYLGQKSGTNLRNQQWHVVVDGEVSQPLPDARNLQFSADSTRYACVVNSDTDHLYIDGKLGTPAIIQDDFIQFSPVGSRLAAIVESRFAGPARVYVDGVPETEYERIEEFHFTPDGMKTAYVARVQDRARREGETFVFGGKPGVPGAEVQAWAVSPDSRRHAYAVRLTAGNATRAYVDGAPQADYDDCDRIVFSPDSQQVAFVVRSNDAAFVVLNGQESDPYESIGPVVFSPDSRHLAFVGQVRGQSHAVLDGTPGKPYRFVESLQFLPDGQLTYRAGTNSDETQVLGVEELGKEFAISPDLKRRARLAGGTVTTNWEAGPQHQYQTVTGGVFSPDGQRFAYVGSYGDSRSEPQTHLIVDGIEEPSHDAIEQVRFSADSRHVCYVAADRADGETKRRVYIDRRAGPEIDELWRTYSPEGEQHYFDISESGKLTLLAVRDQTLYRLEIPLQGATPLQEMDRTTPSVQGYTALRELELPFRMHPTCAPAILPEGALLASVGGGNEPVVLCRLPLDGSEPTVVHRFPGQIEGPEPNSLVTAGNGRVYGALDIGYDQPSGAVFTLGADVAAFRMLKEQLLHPRLFTAAGKGPVYGSVQAHVNRPNPSGFGSLQGIVSQGLFISTEGKVTLETAAQAEARDGKLVGLLSHNGQLFAVTDTPSLIRMANDFSKATTLHEFELAGHEVRIESAPVVGPKGQLYGLVTGWSGGPDGHYQVLYRVDPQSGAYQELRRFDQYQRLGPLVVGPGDAMYAIREATRDGFGRSQSTDAIVQIAADGALTELYPFDRKNHGLAPYPYLCCHEGVLYGWTKSGGRSGKGVFYRFGLDAQ